MSSGKPVPAPPICTQLRLLCNENAVLTRALAAAQQRAAQLLSEKDVEIAYICALLMQTQSRNLGLEAENAGLREQLKDALAGREDDVQNGSAGVR